MDDTSLFTEVADFEVDAANKIWIYDYQGRRLFLFDSTGTIVRRIGRQGSGPGEFSSGNGMVALPDTGIAMLDAQNARLSFFAVNGDSRTSFPVPSGFSTSNGLMTDRSHTLYLRRPVTPPREGEILGRMGLVRLAADGAFSDSLEPPDLPVQRDVYLAVSPDGNGRSSTSTSYAPNYFWDWHPDGYFVAGHGGRYEIVIARRGAKPIVIRRTATPVPLQPDTSAQTRRSGSRSTCGSRSQGGPGTGPRFPRPRRRSPESTSRAMEISGPGWPHRRNSSPQTNCRRSGRKGRQSGTIVRQPSTKSFRRTDGSSVAFRCRLAPQ
jgi:hypothetical protein